MKHELFALDELKPGTLRPVRVDGVDIVVIRDFEGALHALRDSCSHQRAKLSFGTVERTIESSRPGDYTVTKGHLVRCPWHGMEFDVETGRCLADPAKHRVRSYPVRAESGMVVLERDA